MVADWLTDCLRSDFPQLNFRLSPSKSAFREGDSVTISCNARANPPPDSLTIRKDSNSVAESGTTIVNF